MNSTISDDLTHEHLATEAAKCMENIIAKSQNVTSLHKELLEINLSFTAYIEESKRRLESLRLDLARNANSSQRVVEILSQKCRPYNHVWFDPENKKMSRSPASPQKRNSRVFNTKTVVQENNNNTKNKFSERQKARAFIQWYKHMIDNERQNLTLYFSDDATLEWFGRTVKTRKKVTAFLKYDMQCSRHDFTTVESIEKITTRQDRLQSKEDTVLASPINSPELVKLKAERPGKRRLLRSNCSSPEWAEGCKPDDNEFTFTEKKKLKTQLESDVELKHERLHQTNGLKRGFSDGPLDVGNNGDGILGRRMKRKCVSVTPPNPNQEVGQGDCLPSTSGTDANKSHDALNAQLPKLAVECNGYIEFTRTRNNRSTDAMKWERKCTVQLSYSEDPLNVGEYIIWALRYSDESKCRRNLLAEFEEVANEEGLKKI